MQDAKTGMHCKNLAIVWAPNLLKYVFSHCLSFCNHFIIIMTSSEHFLIACFFCTSLMPFFQFFLLRWTDSG